MHASASGAPAVSVVVPTHNREQRLAALLQSLRGQTLGPSRFEVIVVDDCSTDGTAELLERIAGKADFLGFEVIRRTSPAGPAAARNAGWRAARAPLVAFTDDDCEAAPSWLEEMVASSGNGEVALQGRTEPIPREAERIGPFTRTLSVTQLGPFYPTCNMAYPKAMLEGLGGFDESYPAPGGEDTDLALRALERGARIEFADEARVFHAVNEYGPVGKLRWALHWAHAMQIFARHPSLRRELLMGLFWKSSHALLLLALLGLIVAPRHRLAALLVLPYARHLRARCIAENAGPGLAPYLAVYDAVETYATIRGGARAGVLVL
jgi:glycosyltransferase involved in cell wall biosynthesis